jgi:hypothetical protein
MILKYISDAFESYLISIHSTMNFLNYSRSESRKAQLKLDIRKCLLIGITMFVAWSFGKGRTHYLKYIWRGLQGAMFGLAYSFYFTSRKVE